MRPEAGLVADRGLGAVGDDHEVRRDEALLGEDAKRLGAKLLARDSASLAKPGPHRVERQLAATLSPPDALELDVALGAAAQVEELSVGLQLDPVRAQVVGRLERKRGRRHDVLDARVATGAQHELSCALVRAELLREQLVDAELVVGDDLEIRELDQTGKLDGARVDVPGAVPLHVDERVGSGKRHLVAQLG